MALGSGSGVSSSCDVMERGPLVEVGPLATEPAVSIGRDEEEEGKVVVVGAGLGCWVSSMLCAKERETEMVNLACNQLLLNQAQFFVNHCQIALFLDPLLICFFQC